MPAYYPSGATLDLDFTTASLGGMTLARASGATDGLYTDAAGSSYNTYTNDQPRFMGAAGLLNEPQARTNYLFNSAAPATQTTPSLGVANHALWVIGTGSATITAGTGAATGLGTATAGNPLLFAVTTLGTFTVTVTGSLNRFQLERGGSPTSFIATAGAIGTRAAETCVLATGAWFSSTAGTLLVDFSMPFVGTNTTATGVVTIDDNTLNNRFTLAQNPNLQFVATAATVSQVNTTVPMTVATGVTSRMAARYSSTDWRHAGNGTLGTAQTGKTFPTVTQLSFPIGAAAQLGASFRIRRVTYWNTALVDSDLQVVTTLNAAYGVLLTSTFQASGQARQEFPSSGVFLLPAMRAAGTALGQGYQATGTFLLPAMRTAGTLGGEILFSGRFRLSLLASAAARSEIPTTGTGLMGPMRVSGFAYQGGYGRAVMGPMQATAGARTEVPTTGTGLMTMRAFGVMVRAYTVSPVQWQLPALQASGRMVRGYDFTGVFLLSLRAAGTSSGNNAMHGIFMLGMGASGSLMLPPPSVAFPATLTAPWPPSVLSSGEEIQPRTLTAHFRADASAQVPDGLNVFLKTYQAMWDLRWADSDTMIAFLRANAAKDILWSAPGDTLRLWRIKDWQRTTPDSNHDQVTISLTERPFTI